MKIAAISSHKLGDAGEGKLSNPYQYYDKEMLDENAGLNWYDYGFRSYDPQIRRFMQLDPLTDNYPDLTPYQFAGSDPVANLDLDGLEPLQVVKEASTASGTLSLLYGTGQMTANLIGAATNAAHHQQNHSITN